MIMNHLTVYFLFTYKALEKVSRRILPDMAHRFLFGPPSDFCFARYLIGAVFGAISGTGESILLCFASKI